MPKKKTFVIVVARVQILTFCLLLGGVVDLFLVVVVVVVIDC